MHAIVANREDQKLFFDWNALSISIRYIASIISLATFCCSIIFAVGFPNITSSLWTLFWFPYDTCFMFLLFGLLL